MLPIFIQMFEGIARKSPKTDFKYLALVHEKVGYQIWKSSVVFNATYGTLLPIFIQFFETIGKQSPKINVGTKGDI